MMKQYSVGRVGGLCICCIGAVLSSETARTQVIEEIVVTAEKREASLQDVAVSMTAISAETLEKFAIRDFEDYLTLVPGLSSNFAGPVSNRGVRPVGMRGVQTLSNTIVNGQNTVGFYINDTPIPVPNPRLVDLERIEVLRGPQGTLYGSSSLAGTLKLVTRQPDFNDLNGHVEAGLSGTEGGDLDYEIEGSLNVPLSPSSALRVSAYLEDLSGDIDFVDVDVAGAPTGATESDINSETAYGGRAALRIDPTENFSLRASVMYSKRELDSSNLFTPSESGSDLTVLARFPAPAYDEFLLADVGFSWYLGGVEIVSTTAYFESDSDAVGDFSDTFSPLLLPPPPVELVQDPFANENREVTHETRILSTGDDRFQYVAGVFYTDRKEVSSTLLPGGGKESLLGFPILDDIIFRNVSPRYRDEFAVFGEGSYALTDRWTAALGLRYFQFDFRTLDDFVGVPVLLVPGGAQILEGEAEEDGVVPRFRLEYRPADDYLLYLSAAKGFRMGGANFPLPTNVPSCAAQVEAVFGQPTLPSSFDSDTLWTYELGAKTTLLGGRLVLNTSGFFIEWEDAQVPTGTLCQFSGAVLNVGKVESRGLEAEITAAPTDSLTLSLAASYIDTEVAETFQLPGATVVFAEKGDSLPNIPDWTLAVIFDYRMPISDGWEGFLRGDYRYQPERSASLVIDSIKDSFGEGNVRLGLGNDRWEFALYVDNVSDERPSLAGTPSVGQLAFRGIDNTLRPRSYGVTVRNRF